MNKSAARSRLFRFWGCDLKYLKVNYVPPLHPPVQCRTPRPPRAPPPRWRSCWRWRRSGKGPAPRGWMPPCNTWPDYTPGSLWPHKHLRFPTHGILFFFPIYLFALCLWYLINLSSHSTPGSTFKQCSWWQCVYLCARKTNLLNCWRWCNPLNELHLGLSNVSQNVQFILLLLFFSFYLDFKS